MGNVKKIIRNIPSLKSLPLSFTKIRENVLQLPFPVLSDIIFLFLYGFAIIGFISNLIAVQLFEFGIELTKTEQQVLSFSQLFLQENARPLLLKAALLILLMIIVVYILYCLFQGFSWWYCRKIALEKKPAKFFSYLKEFYKVNIFWFILFVIYNFLSFARDFLSQAEQPGPSIFLSILFFVLLYFTLISYSMLPKKKGLENIKESFSYGIKKIIDILPAYILVFIVFLIIELLLNLSLRISNTLFILIGVFLLMPAISWLRVYYVAVVGNIDKVRSK